MRLVRRHPLPAAVLLCALAVLAARPADGGDVGGDAGGHVPGHGSASGLGTEVVRRCEEAEAATRTYEQGRREAGERRARAPRLEELLDRARRTTGVVHQELGSIARSLYRSGGSRPL